METYWFLIIGGVLLVFGSYLLFRNSGPKDVRDRAKGLEDRYDINLPWWLALWRRLGAGSRIKLLGRIEEENTAQMSVLTTEAQIQSLELQSRYAPEQIEERREFEKAEFENRMIVAREATRNKVSVLTWNTIREKEEQARIDLAKRWEEIQQDLKAGFIYANKEKQYFRLFQEYIFGLLDDRKAIELSDDPAKEDKLKFLNDYIESEEEEFKERLQVYREQQKRLLQASTRKELQGSDEDTNRW